MITDNTNRIEYCDDKMEYTLAFKDEVGPVVYGSGITKGQFVCQLKKGHELPHREGFISWTHPWEESKS